MQRTFTSARSARTLPALAVALVAVVLVCLGFGAVAARAAAPDPERDSTAPTGWHWYYGMSESQVNERLARDGDRIIDLEVQSTSPTRFAIATVRNTGAYERGWYWYYGLSASQLAAKVAAKHARLIDIETYSVGGERRFAAVMVVNSGAAAKNWHWYYGITADRVKDRLEATKSRLIDLESYATHSGTRYAVIMIRNGGVDKRAWWWWRNVALSTVRSKASANGARTFSLDRLPNGRYNALQVKRAGEFSAYEVNVDARRVGDFVSQNGGRIVDLDTYVSGGQRRFTAVIIDNADAFNARVRAEARKSAKLRAARFGMWVKQVGGPVSVGLGADRSFEPASVMKILHHLYLGTRLEANPAEDLNASVQFPTCPASGGVGECAGAKADKDICPVASGVTATGTTTLDNADRQMMAVSDNRMTRAIELRYGRAAMNAFAAQIGAAHTRINHDLGCWQTDNEITLADLGVMIEGATNGAILKTAAVRDRFFATMIQASSVPSGLVTLINQEAEAVGKSSIAASFVANVVYRGKGGSYGKGSRSAIAGFGRIMIPFKVGGQIVPRAYSYGQFYNCDGCKGDQATSDAYAKASIEKFRSAIRSAIASW